MSGMCGGAQNPVDTVLSATSGSFVFFTGVNIGDEIQKCTDDEKNRKKWTDTLKAYEKAKKILDTANAAYDSANKKSQQSQKVKLLQTTATKQQEKENAQKNYETALKNVVQVLNIMRKTILTYQERRDTESWRKWYELFQMYIPEGLSDIEMPPEPPQKTSQDTNVPRVKKEILKSVSILEKERNEQRAKAEKVWKDLQILEQAMINANKTLSKSRDELKAIQEVQKKNNQRMNESTQRSWQRRLEQETSSAELLKTRFHEKQTQYDSEHKKYAQKADEVNKRHKIDADRAAREKAAEDARWNEHENKILDTSEIEPEDTTETDDSLTEKNRLLAQNNYDEIYKKRQERMQQRRQQEEQETQRKVHIEEKKYNPDFMLHGDFLIYKKLLNFCKNLAVQSKAMLYYSMQHFLRVDCLEVDLWKIGTSAVALEQNKGQPLTIRKISHQIIRSFLHMHDTSIQTVIWAYLKYHYGMLKEYEAFTALVFAVQYELKHHFHDSEVWDMAILREFFKEYSFSHNTQADPDDSVWERNACIVGIHHALVNLGIWVVLIEWIGDWKTFIKVWKYERGPLYPFVKNELGDNRVTTHVEINPISTIFLKQNFICPVCGSLFHSTHQITNHVIFEMFGSQLNPQLIDRQYYKKTSTAETNDDTETTPLATDNVTINPYEISEEAEETENTGTHTRKLMSLGSTFVSILPGILHWDAQKVKLIIRGKYWKQYLQSDSNNFNTTKDMQIFGDLEHGQCISVGVNVKHCQEIILMNITTFKTQLEGILPQYRQNFRSKLEQTVVEMEQKMLEFTSGDMANVHNRLTKCRRLLQIVASDMNVNENQKIEGDALHELLEYDPRRITQAIAMADNLKIQGKKNYVFESGHEDLFHKNLLFFTITVLAVLPQDNIQNIADMFILLKYKQKLKKALPIERNPCEILIPATATSSARFQNVLDKFENYGMLLWQKPTYGGYDNELLGKQLFSKNVKLSPVFTIIWNAWIHDLGIENHFMQIKHYTEIPPDESAFNFFEEEAIETPIETLPSMNEKITDKITSEWHHMQKTFGGYNDSTTHMWSPSPTKFDLQELYNSNDTVSIALLEARLLQCMTIILAFCGSEVAINDFCRWLQKWCRDEAFSKARLRIEHPNDNTVFAVNFVHAYEDEYVPTSEEYDRDKKEYLLHLNAEIVSMYKKALVDLCSNFSLMNQYAHKKNKYNLLKTRWKPDLNRLTDEVTEYESNLMKSTFKDDIRILSRIGNLGLNNINSTQNEKIQNLFTDMVLLYPESGFVNSLNVSKETREWWTIQNVEEVADFVSNPVLAEKLKYCQRLFEIWRTESVLIMTEDNPTNQIVMHRNKGEFMSKVKTTNPACAFFNFMLMMTVQVHNVQWIIHCESINGNAERHTYNLESAVRLSRELYEKLSKESPASKTDTRTLKIEKYLIRENLEPADEETLQNILIMGFDHYAAVVENQQKLERQVANRLHDENVSLCSFDNVKDILQKDVKSAGKFRSESRDFLYAPQTGQIEKETRETRSPSRDKKKGYFGKQQRNAERDAARGDKYHTDSSMFNIYCISPVRGRSQNIKSLWSN